MLWHKRKGRGNSMETIKLAEIAARINAHLKRFEGDPEINVSTGSTKTYRYYNAHAWVSGRWVRVVYVSYNRGSSLTKQQALDYLAWLDEGNVGRHFEALRPSGASGDGTGKG